MWRRLVISVAAGAGVVPIAQGEIWHVDAEVAVVGDGRSWEGALRHLQDALANEELAAGDEIWVAAGAYYPDRDASSPEGTGSTLASFRLRDRVGVYGGFPPGGGDGTFGARDFQANPTILSGQLYKPDHPGFGVCDDPPDGAGDCYVETPGVPGCLDPYCCMVVCDQDPFCCAVQWDDLCADLAGDACEGYSSIHVVSTDYGTSGPDTRLDGFIITGGAAHGNPCTDEHMGGGMLLRYGARPTISNCMFMGNTAEHGGAVAVYDGGESALVNCTFVDNEAVIGGAVYVYTGSLLLANCLFAGNTAAGGPGSAVHGQARLVNCTLVGNFSVDDGVAAAYAGEIANCILWGNGPTPVLGSGSVTHSCVEGGHDGEGNIDAEPLFVDAAEGNYRLRHGSPGIDAGSDDALPEDRADLDGDLDTDEPTSLDLDLRGRVLGALVDMGAYELCRHDLDGDGSAGVGDFLALLAAWGTNPGHQADFDGSGDVGVIDFLLLLAHWGPCL